MMIYQSILIAAFVVAIQAAVYTTDVSKQKEMWEKFKIDFERKYETAEEESRRFEIFLNNVKMADELTERDRKNGGTATFGITRFSDLSKAEFESQYLTVTPSEDNNALRHEVAATSTAGGVVDWTGIYTTPIKDQGHCGCCWAFSTAEQIESDSMRVLGTNWTLSSEQFCQCVTLCQGCNGGNTNTAMNYAKSHYVEQNSDYPYTSYFGVTGTCTYSSTKGVVYLSSYTQIGDPSYQSPSDIEALMTNYILSTGPISILVDASAWSAYTSGIMSAATCGTTIDHAVQAVGVDTTSATPYWKIRNQWGTSWGEQGYIQVQYGANSCNLTYQPLYTAPLAK